MGKGQIILLYSGKDDSVLIGKPQTTFFKKSFERHAAFSTEHIRHSMKGNLKFGETVTFDIAHVGDLIKDTYLHITLPSLENDTTNYGYTDSTGHSIIENIKFLIGEQVFEQINGEYMEIIDELEIPASKRVTSNQLINKNIGYDNAILFKKQLDLWIKIPLWFAKQTHDTLPICALTNSTLKIEIKFRKFTDVVFGEDINSCRNYENKKITSCELLVKHYFLETRHRTIFVSKPLDYIITQTQSYLNEQINNKPNEETEANIEIPFKCIMKELYWTIIDEDNIETNRYYNYLDNTNTSIGSPIIHSAKIQINGSDLMDMTSYKYFNKIIPLEYHTAAPQLREFSMYSFAKNPESNDPTGHLNTIGIKTLSLQIKTNPTNSKQFINIYAKSTNIIHIENGYAKMYYVYM